MALGRFDDFNQFDEVLKKSPQTNRHQNWMPKKKQLLDAITWKNSEAEPVINKVVKRAETHYMAQIQPPGKVVEFVQDGDLRDAEDIALKSKSQHYRAD